MHNNFIKHFLVVLIIFSNYSFGKEFEELFTIYVPIENSNKIESSINKSFNSLVFRISGSKSPSNVWKIINSGSSRKDFIQSYSIKNIDMSSYLEVNFDQELVINKFKELSIPIVGYSRPVILFLINIESGSDKPYYVSQESNNEIDDLIIETLAELSNERGLFLELPVLDLEDKKYIANTDILSSSKEYLISKYDFDEFADMKLTNLGVNQWLFSGDIKEDIPAENYIEDIKKAFTLYIESRIQSIYENLIIDTSKTLLIDVTIAGINSYEEYEISKDKLSKIIAISDLEIINFKNNTIAYKVNVMGDFNSFKSSIKNNTFFEIMADNSINSLNLRFIK